MMPWHYRYRTHATIEGGSQFGKSHASELCEREWIKTRCMGLTSIDPHQTKYERLKGYCAYIRPRRPVYDLNFSYPDHITPIQIWDLPEGWEITAHVAQNTSALLAVWDEEGELRPTLERVAKMIFTVGALAGEPPHHIIRLLEFPKKELREWAISLFENHDPVRQQWAQMQYITDYEKWLRIIESAQNRFTRLIGSQALRLFTGIKDDAISVRQMIDERAITLINTIESPYLPHESARVITTLLLSHFHRATMQNVQKPIPHLLVIDEAKTVLDSQAANMLDQVLKGGLRLSLAFHHMGQFKDQPHLLQSLDMNCRINFIFGGQPPEAARRFAERFFYRQINREMVRRENYRTITMYELEEFSTTSRGSSSSSGTADSSGWSDGGGGSSTSTEGMTGELETNSEGTTTSSSWGESWGSSDMSSETESESTTTGTRYAPRKGRELAGVDVWSRDEKVAKFAEPFMALGTQQMFVHLPDRMEFVRVPMVLPRLPRRARVLNYMQSKVHAKSHQLHAAHQKLHEDERRFLERSADYKRGPGRPKKKDLFTGE